MTPTPSPATGAADRVELVLVPREPTEAMIEDGTQAEWEAVFTGDYHDLDPEDVSRDSCREGAIVAYRAMVKAHVGPPSSGAGAAWLEGTRTDGWRPEGSYPTDGRPFYQLTFRLMKWTAYKPDGQRQMGRKGRWQERGEYGGWENSSAPSGPWHLAGKTVPDALALALDAPTLCAKLAQRDATIAHQADDLERLRGEVRAESLEEAARIATDQANEDRKLLRDGVIDHEPAGAAILTSVNIAKTIRAKIARPSADQREGADEGVGRG